LTKTAATVKGKDESARLASEIESLTKAVDDSKKGLTDATKECGEIDAALALILETSAAKIKKLTAAIETAKEAHEAAEKEAKATVVTLPGGAKDVEKITKELAKDVEDKTTSATSTTATIITTSSGKSSGKTATGKPKAPSIPAPKPKDEPEEKDKPKGVPVTVSVSDLTKKKSTNDDDDEDDGEPAEVVPTEVPGGEAQITKEVTENTLAAHNARVDLVKTRETLRYELKTIATSLVKYKAETTKITTEVTKLESEVKSE